MRSTMCALTAVLLSSFSIYAQDALTVDDIYSPGVQAVSPGGQIGLAQAKNYQASSLYTSGPTVKAVNIE